MHIRKELKKQSTLMVIMLDVNNECVKIKITYCGHSSIFTRNTTSANERTIITYHSRVTCPSTDPSSVSFVPRGRKSITRRRLEYSVRKLATGRTSVSEKWFDKMVQSRGSASLRGVSQRVWLSGRL